MDENAQSTTSTGIQDYYNLIKAEHEANNAWSAEQAQKAMDYQTQMSNTAHQREVADLKAAGLNPVLSAGGSGASTGSGVQAQRGDENVTALYGLTKSALDANIKQANAMNNIARAYGSALSSAVDSSASNTEVLDLAGDVAYRLFGVKLDHLKAWLKSIGINSDSDLLNFIGVHTSRIYDKVPVNGSKSTTFSSPSPLSGLKGRTVSVYSGSPFKSNKSKPFNTIFNTAKNIVYQATNKLKGVSKPWR